MGIAGTRSHTETAEELQAEQEFVAALERIEQNQLGETGIRLRLTPKINDRKVQQPQPADLLVFVPEPGEAAQ